MDDDVESKIFIITGNSFSKTIEFIGRGGNNRIFQAFFIMFSQSNNWHACCVMILKDANVIKDNIRKKCPVKRFVKTLCWVSTPNEVVNHLKGGK
jgi:hypothetical protein